MSYIGTKTGGHVFRSNAFNSVRYTGDGTTTQYNLPETVVDDDAVLIHIDGVKQHAPAAYSTSGTTLTFTGAPPSASSIEIILFGIGEVNIHTPTSNSVGISALKTPDGTAGQVLTTDGAGVLSFSSKSTETLASMGVTSTAAELNILDGVTSTAAELNILDGVTTSTAELNHVGGVTSAIQTQLGTMALKANNLSDLASATTARTNLGLVIGTDVQAYDATIVVDADIGVTVQAYDADTTKNDVANTFTAQQTFKETAETVYTLSGLDIDPANGQIQIKTLAASVTFTESLATGQAVILGLNDGTAYTATMPTITWTKTGGTALAPVLATTGYTWILLWKVGSTLYGSEMGQP